jgi:ubiquinone/menaquinone biosynthesis C-methylase UbiE
VADVGAGDGEWAELLAREVGSAGHVFATEVDETEIGKIEERVKKAGLANVTAILGTAQKTGLPDECRDAVLLRMVYHHFTEPARMRASLRAALRPGAPLVVIDTEPQSGWPTLSGVKDRQGHGIAEEQLVQEMTADGFEVVSRHPDWAGSGDRYCVVFRRSPANGAGERR